MKKENQAILGLTQYLSDCLVTFLSYLLAERIRMDYLGGVRSVNMTGGYLLWIMAAYCLGIGVLYYLTRVYTRDHYSRIRSISAVVFLDNILGSLVLFSLLFMIHEEYFSRGVILLFFAISTIAVIGKHKLTEWLTGKAARSGGRRHRVLLVGAGSLAEQYCTAAGSGAYADLYIEGYVGDRENPGMEGYLGGYDKLREVLDARNPDEVVIALEASEHELLRKALTDSAREGIRVKIIPTYNAYIPPHPSIDVIGESRLIDINATPLDNLVLAGLKRLVDIVLSLAAIVLTSPIMIAAAVGVKLSSPGPIFFVQERVGRNKKVFPMIKFRSMRVNADEKTAWSTNRDPRKTAFGSLIRKTSIDELPQLFNVLLGQMSLVGPRPEIPFHVSHFKDEIPRYLVRQQVRPGITGWAQVNGLRGDTSIEKRVEYDLWYIDNWSLRLDFEIMVRTILFALVNDEKLEKRSPGKRKQ